jgi:MGT family glycosyltransferase
MTHESLPARESLLAPYYLILALITTDSVIAMIKPRAATGFMTPTVAAPCVEIGSLYRAQTHKVFLKQCESLSGDRMQTTGITRKYPSRQRARTIKRGSIDQVARGIVEEPTMKIGFLSLPVTGHLNSMTALARKLQSRGYEVVFFGAPDAERVIRAADLEFVPFCENEYPLGSIDKSWGAVAHLHGLDVVRYTARELAPGLLRAALKHLPGKIAETGVKALVLDSVFLFLEIIPIHLRVPYVQIWSVLHFDLSGATPLTFYGWPHETTPEAIARNLAGLEIVGELLEPTRRIAQAYADRNGLDIDWSSPTATSCELAAITQTPKEFDFPIPEMPPAFYYAGPLHDNEGREPIPFSWEKLSRKPLIYASMGTLVNGLKSVYRTILEAVGEFPEMQVVLSVGRNVDPNDLGSIPTNTIVVPVAPQIELLKRATLCITHAGLNTTLEALAQGVPMVAIPIGYDQPGIANRISYHGVGEFVDVGDLTARRLSELMAKVTSDPSYRDKARWFQKVLREARGLDVAADIIEGVFGAVKEVQARSVRNSQPLSRADAQSISEVMQIDVA